MAGNVKGSASVEKPRTEGVEIWILSLRKAEPSTACQLLLGVLQAPVTWTNLASEEGTLSTTPPSRVVI